MSLLVWLPWETMNKTRTDIAPFVRPPGTFAPSDIGSKAIDYMVVLVQNILW